MRFYYISLFSLILLGALYVVGTGLLLWFGAWLRKRMNKPWMVMVPLFALLYIGPVAEELWIAWNFGQLCRKDAGIFIYKTVEVEGFYDATRSTHDGPRNPQAIEEYERSGYSFYEKNFRDTGKVVHIEKINGVWTPTILDHPTARYHFKTDSGVQISHGVRSQTSTIVDTKANELIARYTRYNREAPWFFIGLDRPRIACDGPDGGPITKHSFLIYRDVLKPAHFGKGASK